MVTFCLLCDYDQGVDFFSGRAVGNHYAANDFTLFKLCLYYTQITADFAFLEEKVAGTYSCL
jgi:hypothetical protein